MERPNILIFMTDQQHAETIGNNGLCRTPHLGRLIKDGVTFTNAFTPCPMCTPARASTMTGLYPHQHKLIQNAHSKMTMRDALEEETIGDAMKKAGYQTVYSGKWHVGLTNPTEHGFDKELQLESKNEDEEIKKPVRIQDQNGSRILAGTAAYPAEDSFVFRMARSVVRWLDDDQKGNQPFLMFASCHEPHVPWIVPEPYASMYDPSGIPEWSSYRDDLKDKPMTYTKHYNGVNFCRLQNNWSVMSDALSKYYGAVSMADDAFGMILSKLEEKKLLDNTIIVFTSDHGELMGRHGLIGKNEIMLDDLIRIPMVFYWKGKFLPGKRNDFISLNDLYNTLLELGGSDTDDGKESISFVPALNGRSFPARKEIVVQHHGATIHMNTVRAIRTEQYKYVFRAHEMDEFYDLEQDSEEMTNLIGHPEYREEILKMRQRLLDWAKLYQDTALLGMDQAFANPQQAEFN
jgi:arylsulfatase A-like enzyme